MLEIKINTKFIQEDYDEKPRERRYLTINGITDEDSFYLEHKNPSGHFYNSQVTDILKEHSFEEIGNAFTYISFPEEIDWWENSISIHTYCKEYYDEAIPSFKINMQLQDWEHWAKPWSMSSLAKEFEQNVSRLGNDKIKYFQDESDSILNGFGVCFYPSHSTLLIGKELNTVLQVLKSIVEITNKNLLESLESEAVFTYFQFPEEIKTICKQYIVYFAQFIADMGIVVDTELKEELNYTLFKVVPKDKEESLDKIKEALNIYLNVPNDKNFQSEISKQQDIAAKQWEANFYHLKSQLTLATSILQAKEATIEMLQLSNYQYKQLIESRNSNSEEIIKGIVAVKKFEGKGFSIDFAEIFRRLKRKIKK